MIGADFDPNTSFDPFLEETLADPYPQYAEMRKAGGVIHVERIDSWVAFGYNDVKEGFHNRALSADRTLAKKYRGPKTDMRSIMSEPPAHTAVRAPLNKGMAPMLADPELIISVERIVEDMLDPLRESVERYLEESGLASARGEIEFIHDFASPLPIRVIGDLLGIPAAERDRFEAYSEGVARSMDRFYRQGEGVNRAEFEDYFMAMVRERRANPGDDLVSRVLVADAARSEPLTDEEVAFLLGSTLVVAGHETTANLLGNGLRALLQHPDQFERFRDDPEGLVDTAVEEFLRFDSPAQATSRTVVEPTTLGGAELEPGETILLVIGSANRDESEFGETSEMLDVGRNPNPHFAFGRGHHTCPGARLSRIEARVGLLALLERFPNMRFGEDAGKFRSNWVLRGLERLPIVLG